MKGFQSIVQKYLKNHKNHKRYLAVVLALSVLVSFAVPLSLMMPAISMTNDPGETEVDLSNLSLNYDNSVQILDNQEPATFEYKPERYTRSAALQKGDAKPGNEYGFFDKPVTQIPTYVDEEGNEITAKLLNDGYNNSDGANDISSITVKIGDQSVSNKSNPAVITIPEVQGDRIDNVEFSIEYTFDPTNTNINKDNPCIYYQLPDGIIVPDEFKGSNCRVTDPNYKSDNNIAGYYSISSDGLIVIRLTDNYIDYIEENGSVKLSGSFDFKGSIQRANTASGDQTIDIGGIQINVEFPDKNYTVAKNGKSTILSADKNGDIYIQWKVEVSSYYLDSAPFTNMVLEDAKLSEATDVIVYAENGTVLDSTCYSVDKATGKLTFNQNPPDSNNDNASTVTVTYKEKITAAQLEALYESGSSDNLSVTNTATLKDSNGEEKGSDTDTATFAAPTISKSGQEDYKVDSSDYNHKICWTIDVASPYELALGGYSVQDDAFIAESIDRLTVKDQNGNLIDNSNYIIDSSSGKLTFNASVTATSVTITYYSDAVAGQNSNTAKLLYPNDNQAKEVTVNATYTEKTYTLTKDGTYNDDGTITWTVGASGSSSFTLDGYVLTDDALSAVELSNIIISYCKGQWNEYGSVMTQIENDVMSIYSYDLKIAEIRKSGDKLTITSTNDFNAWSSMVYEISLAYTTASDATGITSSTSGNTTTYSNTVSDNYNNKTGVTGTAEYTPRNEVSKSYVSSSGSFPQYDGQLTDENRIQTLSWQIDLIEDGGYNEAIVDIIGVSGDGAGYAEHYLSLPDQANNIKVYVKNASSDSYTQLDSGYTIKYYSDSEKTTEITTGTGQAKSFTITFDESMQNAYKYVQVTYDTTAVINDITFAEGSSSTNITFTNQASFGGVTSNLTNPPSVTIKDSYVIETMDLTVNKSWTNEDDETEHAAIHYIVERQYIPANGTAGEWETVYKSGDEWVVVTTNNEGKYTLNDAELTDYPYSLSGSGSNWYGTALTGLPKETIDHDGYYQYRVTEMDCPEGYITSYSSTSLNSTGTITITNKLYKEPTFSKTAIDTSGNPVTSINIGDLNSVYVNAWINNVNVQGDYYLFKWEIDVSNMPVGAELSDVLTPTGTLIFTSQAPDGNYYPQYYDASGNWANTTKTEEVNSDGTTTIKFKVDNENLAKIIYYTAVPKSTVDTALESGDYTVDNSVTYNGETKTASVTVKESEAESAGLLEKKVNKQEYENDTVTIDNGQFSYTVLVNPEGKTISKESTYDITDYLNISAFGDLSQTDILNRLSADISNIKIEEIEPYDPNNPDKQLATIKELANGTDYRYTIDDEVVVTRNVTYIFNNTNNNDYHWETSDYKEGDVVTLNFSGTPNTTLGTDNEKLCIITDGSYNNPYISEKITLNENGEATLSFTVPDGATSLIVDNYNHVGFTVVATAVRTERAAIQLNLTVPDATPLRVTYTYQLYLDGQPVSKNNGGGSYMTAGNNISLDTGSNKASDSADDTSFFINDSGAEITTDGLPQIVKSDISNYGLSLNATFYAAKYDLDSKGWLFVTNDQLQKNENGEWININSTEGVSTVKHNWTYSDSPKSDSTFPEDACNISIISGVNKVDLTSATLYKLIEVAAPDGYEGTNLDFETTSYKNLKELLQVYFTDPNQVTDSSHIRFLNKFVSVHYFTYNGSPSEFPTGITSDMVTNITSAGTLNIYNNNLIDVTVEKTWAGIEAIDSNYQVEVQLMWSYTKSSNMPTDIQIADAAALGLQDSNFNPVTIITGNSRFTWSDLPSGLYDAATQKERPIYYYIKEIWYSTDGGNTKYSYTVENDTVIYKNGDDVGKYTPVFTGNAVNSEDSVISITNSSGLTIQKLWNYYDNVAMNTNDIPVTSVSVNIYGVKEDGTEEFFCVKTLESPSWTLTLMPEDISAAGINLNDYVSVKVVEDTTGLENFMSPSYVPNLKGTVGEYTIVNKSNTSSIITEKTSITVQKSWKDGLSSHSAVEVNLYRKLEGGTWETEKIDTQTLSDKNSWSYTWDNLDKTGTDGVTNYYYKVEEVPVEGYKTIYSVDNDVGINSGEITVTNIKLISLKIQKLWAKGDHAGDTVTVEVHRSTNKADAPSSTLILNVTPSIVNLSCGGSTTVTASRSDITVSSSDSNIATATVTDGVITITAGNTTGTVAITVTAGTETVTITVNVSAEPQLAISVPESLVVGTNGTASVTYGGEAVTSGVTFESSNTSIATVDSSGTITPLKYGAVQITAKYTVDGVEKTAISSSIQVIYPTLPSTGSAITVTRGTTATITPDSQYGTFTYESNNSTIASVDASTGVVTGVANGTAIITAIRDDGATQTFDVTVKEATSTVLTQSTDQAIVNNSNENISVPDEYSSKEVSTVEVYYRNILAAFPNHENELNIWFNYCDVNNVWTSVGEVNAWTISENVAKWTYADGATNANRFGYITWQKDDIQKIVITYKDGSTYTINNSAYVETLIMTLDQTSVTVTVGGTAIITASNAAGSITCTPASNDIATATISGNTITVKGVAAGSTTLTVSDGTTNIDVEVKVTEASSGGDTITGTATYASDSTYYDVNTPSGKLIQSINVSHAGETKEWDEISILIQDDNNNVVHAKTYYNNGWIAGKAESSWIEKDNPINTYDLYEMGIVNDNTLVITFSDGFDADKIQIASYAQGGSGKFDVYYTITYASTDNVSATSLLMATSLLFSSADTISLQADEPDSTLVGTLELNQTTAKWTPSGGTEISPDATSWETIISDLPAYDETGQPYYYWVEETAVTPGPITAYETAYSFNDGDDNSIYYINADNPGDNPTAIIQNTPKDTTTILPSTSGEGTTRYYITGIAIMLSSSAAYILFRRRRKKAP